MLSVFRKFLRRGDSALADPARNLQCTEFEVNNWVISQFVVDKLFPVVGVVPFPLNEQMLMAAAVCRLKPTHIFEWGTNIGKSARIFYETCRTFDINAVIHSIDLPDDVPHVEHPGKDRGLLVRGIGEISLHLGDGLETSLDILAHSTTGIIRPLFLIDGDHGYDSVKRELTGIIKAVPQSNILLHDTFWQSDESKYNVGPYRALCDVLKGTPHHYRIVSQNMGLPGMTLLWQG